MKHIIIFITFLIRLIFTQEDKLSERYFIDFKNDNFQKEDYIDFHKNTFTMKHSNLLPYSGTVNCNRTLTSLISDFIPAVIIDFRTNEIENDIIKFQMYSRKAGIINYLDVSVNRGKFIKIK